MNDSIEYQRICLTKLNGLHIVANKRRKKTNEPLLLTLQAELITHGFILSEELYGAFMTLTEKNIVRYHGTLMEFVKEAVGAHVRHTPMYPNFPEQVMEASDAELLVNAIVHYWTLGEWTPEYENAPRPSNLELPTLKILGLVNDADVARMIQSLLKSNDSLSERDKGVLEYFVMEDPKLVEGTAIPFKENLCFVAGVLLENEQSIEPFITTTTDVLRIATHLSGGDISLGEKTKFKSQPRRIRRQLCNALERVYRDEDIQRHRGKWIKLAHSLHVGEFSSDLHKKFEVIRTNGKIWTFNGRVQKHLDANEIPEVTALLKTRPGEMARRLDHLLRSTTRPAEVIKEFACVVDKISTRILMSVLGHMRGRRTVNEQDSYKIYFPKGQTQKFWLRQPYSVPPVKDSAVRKVIDVIETSLTARFSKLDGMGKVWVDPELVNCPLPAQQRSASDSLFTLARGTRIPLQDAERAHTIRMFCYWVGQDIDLSATLFSEDFTLRDQISYTNLRNRSIKTCHSGDIVDAPHGASEFIDVDIEAAIAGGFRYVVMEVYVFAGPDFKDHDTCFVGWMTRAEPKSNEIYEPKTVQQKIDLTMESRRSIPVIFDLQERKIIWVDMAPSALDHTYGRNLESNRPSTQQLVKGMLRLDNKASLYDLFSYHGEGRGELVDTKEEADTIFSLDEGVTPFDVNTINSDFLV